MSRLEQLIERAGQLHNADSSFREAVMEHLDLTYDEAAQFWLRLRSTVIESVAAGATAEGRAPWQIDLSDVMLVSLLIGIHTGIAAERERWAEAKRLADALPDAPSADS